MLFSLLNLFLCEGTCRRPILSTNSLLSPSYVRFASSRPSKFLQEIQFERKVFAPFLKVQQTAKNYTGPDLSGYKYDQELDLLYKYQGSHGIKKKETFPLPGVQRKHPFIKVSSLHKSPLASIYKGVGYVESSYKSIGLDTFGSGFLIFPDMVLTAAHNVVSDSSNADSVTFYFNYDNGKSNFPPQLCSFKVPGEWQATGDPIYDFAVLFLPTSLQTQIAKMACIKDGSDFPIKSEVIGYPARVHCHKKGKKDNTPISLYTSPGNIKSLSEQNKVLNYDCYTFGGNSGGPVVVSGNMPFYVGVHTRGGHTLNHGVHHTNHMVEYIKKWIKEKENLEKSSPKKTIVKLIHEIARTDDERNFLYANMRKFNDYSERNLKFAMQLFLDGRRSSR